MQPIVITYENDPTNAGSIFFRETLARNGWSVKVVGEGETWIGFLSKIRAYRAACDTLPDDQVVIFSDARDVVCVRPPRAFLDAYTYMNAEIVVSAEVFCDFQTSVSDDYVGKVCVSLAPYYRKRGIEPGLRPFVNSGLIAGTVGALRTMWQWILDKGHTDDQIGVGMYMNAHPEKVRIDSDALLLHTSTFGIGAGIYMIHTQKHDSPTFAELHGCAAFFLHIPGSDPEKALHGQQYLYKIVVEYLRTHSGDALLKLYEKLPPKWDQYGDLPKRLA